MRTLKLAFLALLIGCTPPALADAEDALADALRGLSDGDGNIDPPLGNGAEIDPGFSLRLRSRLGALDLRGNGGARRVGTGPVRAVVRLAILSHLRTLDRVQTRADIRRQRRQRILLHLLRRGGGGVSIQTPSFRFNSRGLRD